MVETINPLVPFYPDGLSVRDYFAGQALCGWAATGNPRFDPKGDAEWCYKLADAMLKERAKEEPK